MNINKFNIKITYDYEPIFNKSVDLKNLNFNLETGFDYNLLKNFLIETYAEAKIPVDADYIDTTVDKWCDDYLGNREEWSNPMTNEVTIYPIERDMYIDNINKDEYIVYGKFI